MALAPEELAEIREHARTAAAAAPPVTDRVTEALRPLLQGQAVDQLTA